MALKVAPRPATNVDLATSRTIGSVDTTRDWAQTVERSVLQRSRAPRKPVGNCVRPARRSVTDRPKCTLSARH